MKENDKQTSRNRNARIDWHSGFNGGLELELREYLNDLEIEHEHPLSKEPIKMDMLILKKKSELIIENEIGRIFRQRNVIEYKGIGDALSIDTLYKAIAYACL